MNLYGSICVSNTAHFFHVLLFMWFICCLLLIMSGNGLWLWRLILSAWHPIRWRPLLCINLYIFSLYYFSGTFLRIWTSTKQMTYLSGSRVITQSESGRLTLAGLLRATTVATEWNSALMDMNQNLSCTEVKITKAFWLASVTLTAEISTNDWLMISWYVHFIVMHWIKLAIIMNEKTKICFLYILLNKHKPLL